MRHLILSALLVAVMGCVPAAESSTVPTAVTDFHLGWLDGVSEQPYTKDSDLLARTYMIVMDGSGSMEWDGRSQCPQITKPRIRVAQDAMKTFAHTINKSDKVGLVQFVGGNPKYSLPLAYDQSSQLVYAVDQISPSGGTPLRSAISLAYDELRKEGSRKKGHGEYHLVIITDGDPSSVQEDPAKIVRRIAGDSPIQIHSIGFCLRPGHSLNQHYLNYYQADDAKSLTKSLQSVLAESTTFSNSSFN